MEWIMSYRRWCLVISAVFLSGCGSMPSLMPTEQHARPQEAVALDQRIGTLVAQRLAPGECGMFLWSRSEERPLVFFSNSKHGDARVMIDGRQQEIPKVAAAGEAIAGQQAEQSFSWRDLRFNIAVEFERRRELPRGAVIQRGTLQVQHRDGWHYVVPVGGLVACED